MEGSEGRLLNKSRVVMDPSTIASSTGRKSTMTGIDKKSLSRMRIRKQSYGFAGIPGVAQGRRRSSQLGMEFRRPPMIYLNTYQLGPSFKFHVPSVTKAINSILDTCYGDVKYSAVDSPGKTMQIADEITRAVKYMNFDRYRIISVVTTVQKRSQCYNNAIAFLWDHERDNYADVLRDNHTSFIQVTVFGVYLD